jgi:hypothetical protein
MKKPDANPVDQVEVDQEAAQLVSLIILFKNNKRFCLISS